MKLYPEMDEKIVGLLRVSGDPKEEYAATLIESLRDQVANLEKRELRHRTALEKIAQHDGSRWMGKPDSLERQPRPQEIATEALKEPAQKN